MELRREKGNGNTPKGGRGEGKGTGVAERRSTYRVLHLEGFKG